MASALRWAVLASHSIVEEHSQTLSMNHKLWRERDPKWNQTNAIHLAVNALWLGQTSSPLYQSNKYFLNNSQLKLHFKPGLTLSLSPAVQPCAVCVFRPSANMVTFQFYWTVWCLKTITKHSHFPLAVQSGVFRPSPNTVTFQFYWAIWCLQTFTNIVSFPLLSSLVSSDLH